MICCVEWPCSHYECNPNNDHEDHQIGVEAGASSKHSSRRGVSKAEYFWYHAIRFPYYYDFFKSEVLHSFVQNSRIDFVKGHCEITLFSQPALYQWLRSSRNLVEWVAYLDRAVNVPGHSLQPAFDRIVFQHEGPLIYDGDLLSNGHKMHLTSVLGLCSVISSASRHLRGNVIASRTARTKENPAIFQGRTVVACSRGSTDLV